MTRSMPADDARVGPARQVEPAVEEREEPGQEPVDAVWIRQPSRSSPPATSGRSTAGCSTPAMPGARTVMDALARSEPSASSNQGRAAHSPASSPAPRPPATGSAWCDPLSLGLQEDRRQGRAQRQRVERRDDRRRSDRERELAEELAR